MFPNQGVFQLSEREELKGMKIVITGGNGFLGSNVTRHLVEEGHTILVVSRKCDTLVDILDRIQFVRYEDTYVETIKRFSPECIVHFSWEGGNSYRDVNSLRQFTNIQIGIDVLEAMETLPKKPMFIGVGSFSEYGIITERAKESQLDNPVTMYGLAKSIFKTLTEKYCALHDIPWAWIRPCYVYGANDVRTRLIPSVVEKLLNKEPVTLDSCNVTIDYLHVSDFCRGVRTLIETRSTGVFNICSGNEYRLKDILQIIEDETNSKGNIVFDEALNRKCLSTYICGDNSNLKTLDWNPSTDLMTGLRQVVRERKSELFLKSNPVDHDGLHGESI